MKRQLLIAIIFLSASVQAQEKIELEQYCNYAGSAYDGDVFGFASDSEAVSAVGKVMQYAGLEPNFVIMAANVPNAAAVIQGPKRLILYNQSFMEEIQNATQTDWGRLSILAHEIGHHLQGHTLQAGGSRPEIELQADKYSGFILQRMGATLNEAQTAMRTLGSDQGSSTHPAKQARLAAIANGYIAARELNKSKPDASAPSTTPVPQTGQVTPTQPPTTTPTQPVGPTYVLRVVFPQDPASYYVTSANDIVGVTPQGQVVQIGRRIPPTVPGFAWMYATAYLTYGVDAQGQVWSRHQNGVPFQVGYVTNP